MDVSSCAVSGSTGWCVLLVGVDGSGLDAVYALEDELADALVPIGGEVDGHGVGDDGVEVFAYGSDVDALRQALEDALRSSPFELWEITPAGLLDGDDDDPSETPLPAVEVWRVTAPPWFDDSWIELRSSQHGTVNGSRLIGMFEAVKRRDGFEPQPGTGSLSPVFALTEPLQGVDGSFHPWVVLGPRGVIFESLSLPSWLLTAPSTFQVSAAAARRAMWSHSEMAELRSRRSVRDIVDRAGTYLHEVAQTHVTGVVWWWDHDSWSTSTQFAHGSELVELLMPAQPGDGGRNHLIEGLRDADGAPAYWNP